MVFERGFMQLIDNFKENFSHMFDFFDNYTFDDKEFLLYARFNQRNTRYFASKKIEIYSFSNSEHLFIQDLDSSFGADDLNDIEDFVRRNMVDIVKPSDEHMSTVMSMVVFCDDVEEGIKKKIKKFKLHKEFKFGFNGWMDTKLIVVVKDKNIAFENKLAKGDAIKLKFIEDKNN